MHHQNCYIQNKVMRKSVLRYGVLVPEEIIMQEILTRLPIKSLLRFRCVCKSWKSQLYNPDYLSLLNRSSSVSHNNNYDYLIVMYHYFDNRKNLLYFLSSGVKQFWESRDFNNVLCKTPINNVPYPLSLSKEGLHLVGSVNGLVCMAFYFEGEHQFILWNPTIRLSKTILVPNDLGLRRWSRMVYGFGWDSKTDDYKLIIIPLNRVSPACVYSCKTDCWSNINNAVSMVNSVVWHKCKPPCAIVNGSPYWSEWTDTNILKFDVTSNEFTLLNLPSAGCFIYGLINLNGRLALIDSTGSGPAGSVLYSFDEEHSIWVKMCIIGMRLSQSSSRCFMYDGRIVFRIEYGFWYCYDLKSHELKSAYKDFGMYGISLSYVFSYTSSLVALQGMKKALHV